MSQAYLHVTAIVLLYKSKSVNFTYLQSLISRYLEIRNPFSKKLKEKSVADDQVVVRVARLGDDDLTAGAAAHANGLD